MKKFRVVFTGLCAVVPNTDEASSMTVLLIDGRAPGLTTKGSAHVSHQALLRFTLADLDESKAQPEFDVYMDASSDKPQGQWYFNGDEVEIRIDGKPLKRGLLEIIRSNDNYSFDLLPHSNKIYKEKGGLNVDRSCLEVEKGLAEVGLVGRIQLLEGKVGSNPGEYNENVTPTALSFTGAEREYQQRFSASLFYEVEVEGGSVEIYIKSQERSFTFKPQEEGVIEVQIMNVPPKGVEAAKPDDGMEDADYELVYRVAKPQPEQLRVPTRAVIGPEYPAPLQCGCLVYNADDRA